MRILYIGVEASTHLHRALALRRLGHDVRIIDPHALIARVPLLTSWTWRTGSLGVGKYIEKKVLEIIGSAKFDLVWVAGGSLLSRDLIKTLRARYGRILAYNIDDPFGGRDGRAWRLYINAIPEYDLIVVPREVNVQESYGVGARQVLRVFMSCDEIAHAPRVLTEDDLRVWSSEVSFIGTWFPERGPFIKGLIDLDVPISIYGNRWDRAPEWNFLKSFWKGPGLSDADKYAKAIQCSKVSLGLLSKGNRDLHTTRSSEIPMLGGVLCAERTEDHLALYEENTEAIFWNTVQECADACTELLSDESRRREVALHGHNRCLRNGTLNEPTLERILNTIA
ncbi:MAG: CgeB family protein [Janthinobacterium lividum]